jgi:hypothetical protein
MALTNTISTQGFPFWIIKNAFSLISQVQGQRRSPQLKDPRCDNVLPDVGYRTHQSAVKDEYKIMVVGGRRRNSEEKLLQCHFVHREFHKNLLGTDGVPLR